jgi:maltose-binding protein MalE
LFANKKISIHILIFIALFLFGVSIEYAQEYSNQVFHTKIHGRYDPEDVQSNLKGLIGFSIVWVGYVVVGVVFRKTRANESL